MDKKVMFIIRPHSIVDIITNSSSELFVFEGKEKDAIDEMLKIVYPNYLTEYEELKNITELSVEDLDLYISFATGSNSWPAKKEDYVILPGFTFDELYQPERDYRTGEIKPAWNGEIQYRLKQNSNYRFVTKENKNDIINRICPDKNMFFLFSMDENPKYEYQQRLEMFGQRIHLG